MTINFLLLLLVCNSEFEDDNDILFEEDYVAIENGELYNNYLQLHKIYKCENYDKI